jgi:hypothetical protein
MQGNLIQREGVFHCLRGTRIHLIMKGKTLSDLRNETQARNVKVYQQVNRIRMRREGDKFEVFRLVSWALDDDLYRNIREYPLIGHGYSCMLWVDTLPLRAYCLRL